MYRTRKSENNERERTIEKLKIAEMAMPAREKTGQNTGNNYKIAVLMQNCPQL